MENILIGALLVLMLLLLSIAPLALLLVFYGHGLITWEELAQAISDLANGQVRL